MQEQNKDINEKLLGEQLKTEEIKIEARDEEEIIMVDFKKFRTIVEKKESDEKNKGKNKKKVNTQILKRLLKYSKEEKFLSTMATLTMLISIALQTYIPKIVGIMLDTCTKATSMKEVNKVALDYLFVFIAFSVFMFFRSLTNSIMGEKIAYKMRQDIFNSFINFDIEFYDTRKTGELLSRINSDVATIKWAASGNMSVLIRSSLMCIGSFVLLFYINWKLTLILLSTVPLYIIVTVVFGKINKDLAKKYQDIIANSSIIAEESFGNIRTVKSFGSERKETEFYNETIKEVYKVGKKKAFWESAYFVTTNIFTYAAMLAILWYGGSLVVDKEISTGELTAFMLYSMQLTQNSSAISWTINSLVTAIGVAEKLFSYLDYKPKVVQSSLQLISIHDQKSIDISITDIIFKYPTREEVTVLDQISCEIKQGEVIALVGSSGEGKSTFLSILQRFYDIQQGSILINGHDLKQIDLLSLRQAIGYVSQEPVLFSGTIEENIVYGVEKYNYAWLKECCRQSNCLDFILDPKQFPLGFKTIVGERGLKLSGGQKQRISIARALIKKPKILIFDEATSALDSESEFKVQESISNIMKHGQMTIIVIAHRLSTIINSQRILVISKGQIVEEGNHQSLLNLNGVYKQLIQKQIQGLSSSNNIEQILE